MTIELKRHHAHRIKKNRAHYWNNCVKTPKMTGKLRKTPHPCSCLFCRNKRSYNGETLQELRFTIRNQDYV